jgi:hypothetical protein
LRRWPRAGAAGDRARIFRRRKRKQPDGRAIGLFFMLTRVFARAARVQTNE